MWHVAAPSKNGMGGMRGLATIIQYICDSASMPIC